MPGAQPGPTTEHLRAEVALRHLRPLRPQLRHGGGHDRRVDVGERQPAQLEQGAQRGAELVGGRARARWRSASPATSSVPSKVPRWVWVLPTSTTRSMAAGRRLDSPRLDREAVRSPRLAPMRRDRGRADAQGRPLPADRHDPGGREAPAMAPLPRPHRPRRGVRRRPQGARLARDHPRARAHRARAAAAAARRPRAAQGGGGRAVGASRCCSRSCAGSCGRRCAATRARS